MCVCVCEAHEQSRATLVQFLSENSRAFGTVFFKSRALFCYAKEKREQYIFFALFPLYSVVHLTVTYTGRLSSLVL